jgi:hypothetical protein
MSKEIRVSEKQSLFDIAVEKCGSAEAVFAIAELNDLAITDAMIAGQTLLVSEPTNKAIADYYQTRGLKPATDATTAAMDELRNEGVDYWALEVDFVVQ